MGVVVLVALGAFRVGQRSWEKGDSVVLQNQRLRIAADRIRQQLAAATVYISPGEGDTFIGFEGSRSNLRFVSRVSLIPGREQGLVFVHYRITETAAHGYVLSFYERPVMTLEATPDADPAPEDYHTLIGDLTDAGWDYRGGEEAVAEGWRDIWDAGDQLTLPDAVRLSLRSGQEAPLAVVIRVVNPGGA